MSRQTAHLLEAYESLPEEEKRIFTAEFLRRAIPFDSGPLDDQETARAADELFGLPGAGENDARPAVRFGCSTSAWRRRSARLWLSAWLMAKLTERW